MANYWQILGKSYISSVRNDLDPGFAVKRFGKLFEAPSPLSKLRSTKALAPVQQDHWAASRAIDGGVVWKYGTAHAWAHHKAGYDELSIVLSERE